MLKKSLFFIVVLLLSTTILHAQNNKFTLRGEIKGMTSGHLLFGYTDNNEQYVQKNVPVKNGKFQLEGTISEPTNMSLRLDSTVRYMDDPNLTDFWIEASDMQLEIVVGKFKEFKLSGSKTNEEEQELNRQQAPIRENLVLVFLSLLRSLYRSGCFSLVLSNDCKRFQLDRQVTTSTGNA